MARSRNRVGFATGFTLVELLVVIGIIALLIGILMPVLSKARQSAYETVCMSNMRQFGIAMQIYADANQGFLPQKGPDGHNAAQAFGPITNGNNVIGYDDASIWFNALPPLLNGESYYQLMLDDYNGNGHVPAAGDHSIFICPIAEPPTPSSPLSADADLVNGNYFTLFGIDSTGTIQGGTRMGALGEFPWAVSYGMNSKLTTTIANGTVNSIVMAQLAPGAEVVIMTEKLAHQGEIKIPSIATWNKLHPAVYVNHAPSWYNYNVGSLLNCGQPKADWTRFAARHYGGGNLLFADGHVAWFAWTDVQYPESQMQPFGNNSDANQYGKIVWSPLGPVN